jgi:hypothetical protein
MNNPGEVARNLARMAENEMIKAQVALMDLRPWDAAHFSRMATRYYSTAVTMLAEMNVKLEA